MQDTNKFENLLTNVSLISKKYDDIAKITGENFNIFSVMQMESNERYTHSAIIGELLNPKGSHGQGSVFLQLFFEEIKELKCIENYNFDNSKCIIEQHIGTIDVDYTKGGFIDIVLKDDKNVIVIENKIYASDQRNQLKRYKNYYPNCVLLYLNLFGDVPSIESILDLELDKDFHIISYYNEITNWLEKCQKETFDQPILRETIKQYLNLVKKLSNQTINDTMSKEIKDLIKSNLKSASSIYHNYLSAKFEVLNKIRNEVFKKLDEVYNEQYEIVEQHEINASNASICIKHRKFLNQSAFFCVLTFSGTMSSENLLGKSLFVGILDYENRSEEYFLKEKVSNNLEQKGWWWQISKIDNFENFSVDFSNLDFIHFLALNQNKLELLAEHIFLSIVNYMEENKEILNRIQSQIANI